VLRLLNRLLVNTWLIARLSHGEKIMKSVLIVAIVAAVALGACRREEAHTPMKLGAPAAEQAAR
jgi:hypothetical protein